MPEPNEAADAPTADIPAMPAAAPVAWQKPDRIGPYVIREVIGEGGFGIVYSAEQVEPVRRRVALKVIKPGMDSRAVVARFEAERQALAVMDHPGVAKVFDGGTVPEGEPGAGRPFFVMEYVAGEPITEFCDRHRLTIEARVSLFIQVCRAVQHAHTKAVIHRDLKPSNILVSCEDDAPRARVIDFGIAKALNQRLVEASVFTEQGQLIGTPEYMSPEQAEMSGLDIDTRADIYSLGVVLYELLTGVRPFDLRRSGLIEIRQILRDRPAEKPSTRLARLGEEDPDLPGRVGHARRSTTRHIRKELRGDLDTIVSICLEKDRADRYASASELAQDLQRFLDGEPVQTRAAGGMRQFLRFVRRNERWIASLLVGLGVCLFLIAQGFMLLVAMSILPEDPAYTAWNESKEAAPIPPLDSIHSILLMAFVVFLFTPFVLMGLVSVALAVVARTRAVRIRAIVAMILALGLPAAEVMLGLMWIEAIDQRTDETSK